MLLLRPRSQWSGSSAPLALDTVRGRKREGEKEEEEGEEQSEKRGKGKGGKRGKR